MSHLIWIYTVWPLVFEFSIINSFCKFCRHRLFCLVFFGTLRFINFHGIVSAALCVHWVIITYPCSNYHFVLKLNLRTKDLHADIGKPPSCMKFLELVILCMQCEVCHQSN